MNSIPSLKELERKSYQTMYQDGIYDITWGFLLLVIAVNPLIFTTGIPRSIIFLVELSLAALWLILGKRYITIPRSGMMKPSATRQQVTRKVLFGGVVVFGFLLLFIIMKATGLFESGLKSLGITPLIFSLVFALVFTALSIIMSYPMLLLAGILFALSIPVSELLYPAVGEPLDTLIPFGVSALIILTIGFLHLMKFISRYSVDESEMKHNDRSEESAADSEKEKD